MKNLTNWVWVSVLCACSTLAFGQDLTQTVRGTVVDKESQFPLPFVNVVIKSLPDANLGATTDENGVFRIDGVPLGRQSIEATYIGYQAVTLDGIVITSAKEMILKIEMEESATKVGEVVVTATKRGEVLNEMATVSTRQFSVEETNRYAGSRGEPARMASNFAGVQGADDSRNDIVIRGNSPQGVLWRLDGINIPNPNHFSIAGTGGGPVTILNNKFLANSDFFTGAFPAEYGNGIAGVFDLKMRNGNNQKHEFSGQLGFLGTELMAEGPLGGGGASYLATFRYSTLQLFSALNIDVGTDAIPQYYDGAFRFNFPLKKGGNLAFWGIGGNSTIDIVLSTATAPDTSAELYGANDRDQYFTTSMFTTGMTYTQPLDKNTFIKAGLAYSKTNIFANHNYIERDIVGGMFENVETRPILDYQFHEGKYSTYLHYNKKINAKTTFKAGINLDVFDLNYIDSVRQIVPATDTTVASYTNWNVRWDAKDKILLAQPFAQVKYKFSDKLTLIGGVTATYSSVNDKSLSPLEPRLGLAYQINNTQKLSFGTGLHSQTQSNYIYYYGDETAGNAPVGYNKDQIGLTKSLHAVIGHDIAFKNALRLKSEIYYQYLYDVPVNTYSSSYSLVNSGSGFSRLFPDSLTNEGTARNYGAEFTLEKFFSGGYYFLVTASFFDAKYKGSDGVLRNSVFNGRYALNALFSKEFTFKNGTSLNIGGKVTRAGGRWYGDVDEEQSRLQQDVVYVDATVNTRQFRPYFRVDGKVSFIWNRPNTTHEISIDFVNFLGIQNILTLSYAPQPDPTASSIVESYQLGFLPLFYYKIDF